MKEHDAKPSADAKTFSFDKKNECEFSLVNCSQSWNTKEPAITANIIVENRYPRETMPVAILLFSKIDLVRL